MLLIDDRIEAANAARFAADQLQVLQRISEEERVCKERVPSMLVVIFWLIEMGPFTNLLMRIEL